MAIRAGCCARQTIIDTNNLVGKALEAGQPLTVIMEHWDFLQVQCAMYINSDLPGLPMAYQSTSKPLRCARRALQNSIIMTQARRRACTLKACPCLQLNKAACRNCSPATMGLRAYISLQHGDGGAFYRCFALVLVTVHVMSMAAAPAGGLCSG